MKIIIGSESFAPNISGVAVHAELLARNLTKLGHEVYVFAPSRNFKTYYDKNYSEYKILRLRSIINPFRKGFRVAFIPDKDVLNNVLKIKPDIIHLQDPTSICSSLLKVAKKEKIPVVVTNHFSLDYVISYLRFLKPLHPQIKKILMRYLSSFYNKSKCVFCPTKTVKNDLKRWGIKTEIKAISNGVDLDRFFSYSLPSSIRLKYHLPENPLVLYTGRIDKDKSIEVLINAIPDVYKKTNAHFVFMGFGDETERMKKMVKKLGVERATAFIGRVEHDSSDKEQIYQVSTVFAIPSAIETQSIVTLEAMASGLPIVAADAGALPELVKNGENGYLVQPGNSREMAESIIKIIQDEKLQRKMGEKSLELVSNHQVEKSFGQIEATYEEILESNK